MKKLLLALALLCTLVFNASSQSARFRSDMFLVGTVSDGEITWEVKKECELYMSIDIEGSHIRIFSQEYQDYRIIKEYDQWQDHEGEYSVMDCMDQEGKLCEISIVHFFGKDTYIIIKYKDYAWAYRIEAD